MDRDINSPPGSPKVTFIDNHKSLDQNNHQDHDIEIIRND